MFITLKDKLSNLNIESIKNPNAANTKGAPTHKRKENPAF